MDDAIEIMEEWVKDYISWREIRLTDREIRKVALQSAARLLADKSADISSCIEEYTKEVLHVRKEKG